MQIKMNMAVRRIKANPDATQSFMRGEHGRIVGKRGNGFVVQFDDWFVVIPRSQFDDGTYKAWRRGGCSLSDEQVCEARRLHAEGWLINDVAEHFNLSRAAMRNLIRKISYAWVKCK